MSRIEDVRQTRQEFAPTPHLGLGGACGRGIGDDTCRRNQILTLPAADDDLVRPVLQGEEAPELVLEQKHRRPVRLLTQALEHATDLEQVVRHAAVGRLTKRHEFVADVYTQRTRQPVAEHDAFGIGRIEPLAPIEPLVDVADQGVALRLQTLEQRSGRRVA